MCTLAALKQRKEAGGKTEGWGVEPKCLTLGYYKWTDGRRLWCCGHGWSLVFRGPPRLCRLPCASPTCRSYHPFCLAPVTGLWMSGHGPWTSALDLWTTWATKRYEIFRLVTQIQQSSWKKKRRIVCVKCQNTSLKLDKGLKKKPM